MYDTKAVNVVVSGVHPTQGGFNIRAGNTITDVDVVYAALTAKRSSVLPGTEARLFYIFYHDDRPVQVVDNRLAAARPFLSADSLAIHSLGAHILTVFPLGPGAVDGLVWGVYQFGQWTNLDQRAGAFAVEMGYQLVGIPLAPWLRLGYFRGSGDSNAADDTHGTFFNVLPTVRLYANFPFYNLMNIEDGFVQLILTPATSTRFVVAAHTLKLSEQNDLFYSGGGAQNRRVSFGYPGRSSNGAQSLANVVETSLSHTFNKYFSGNVYYGHAFGSSVIERFFRGQSHADYFFADLTARF
jgi:Alginate export